MFRRYQTLLAGLLALCILWWFYVPTKIDPSPLPDPNPHRETMDVCALLPNSAVKSELLGEQPLTRALQAIEHYTVPADRTATSMYMVSCGITRADACLNNRIANINVAATVMRNRVRATDRWDTARALALASAPQLWHDEDLGGRPAYSFGSEREGRATTRVWDDRFILSVELRSCTAPLNRQSTQTLLSDSRRVAAALQLPAEQLASRP
jgi:hypothetical protein